MRIVVVGSVQFSGSILEQLILSGFTITGVVAKKSSETNADFIDLATVAHKYLVDSYKTDDINSKSTLNWISTKKADLIVCVGWSQLLKKELLSFPKLGVIGYHPADIPRNRGRHPLIWALALGLNETASTFFLMDEGADSGEILSKYQIHIAETDYAIDLYVKMTEVAKQQIVELLHSIPENGLKSEPQRLSEGNIWRKRGMTDGKIDFRMTSKGIYNLVRALSKPYPGAHIEHKGYTAKVWKSEVVEYNKPNYEPGKILNLTDSAVLVKTSDGAINLIDHEIDFELFKLKNYIGI